MALLFPWTKRALPSSDPDTPDSEDDYQPAADLKASYSGDDEEPAIDPQILATLRSSTNRMDAGGGAASAPLPTSADTGPAHVSPAASINIPGRIDDKAARAGVSGQPQRPQRDVTIPDVVDRERNYLENVQAHEPQAARGWWNRYVKPMIMGSLAGARTGSPWGLLGGAGVGLGIGAAKPTLEDERWKTAEEAKSQGRLEQIREAQKENLGMEKTRAEIAKLTAPKDEKDHPRRLIKNADGTYVSVDVITGLDQFGKPVKGVVASTNKDFTGWGHDTEGVAHYYQNGTDTGRVDPGRNKVKLPNGSLVDPSQKYSADRGEEREDRASEVANEKARQENAAIQANMDAANKNKTESWGYRDQLEKDGKKFVTTYDSYGKPKQSLNPEWVHYDTLGHRFSEDAERYRGQLKPIVKPPARKVAPPPGGFTIEGAIEAFKRDPRNNGRAPNPSEIANMQAAIDALKK